MYDDDDRSMLAAGSLVGCRSFWRSQSRVILSGTAAINKAGFIVALS